jgi:hypothetical protein
VNGVHRVLDIDLDFFVEPVIHWPLDDRRPSADEHSVWPTPDAIEFLEDRCGLVGRRPGFLTEQHDDLFPAWRDAIASGLLKPPFHVTHVDAHADLGLGDAGYMYLMTSLLLQEHEDRAYPAPPPGRTGLTEGNFLLYAIACRWISDLVYVYGEGGGSDELLYAMQGFDSKARHIQLAAMSTAELQRLHLLLVDGRRPEVLQLEPAIPYRAGRWEEFRADQPYDFVCLTRSPRYTPRSADPLYDEIAAKFIEPVAPIRPF